jgi:hypothetical protein
VGGKLPLVLQAHDPAMGCLTPLHCVDHMLHEDRVTVILFPSCPHCWHWKELGTYWMKEWIPVEEMTSLGIGWKVTVDPCHVAAVGLSAGEGRLQIVPYSLELPSPLLPWRSALLGPLDAA